MTDSPAPAPATSRSDSIAAGAESRIVKNASILVALTMVSRVAGLIRDFMITHFFGASGLTDVFYMAFTIPNVMRRLVAEGSLTPVVQPEYQQARRVAGDVAARELYRRVFAFVLVAVAVIVVVGVGLADPIVRAFAGGWSDQPEKLALTTTLTRWMFPAVIAMALVGLAMAVLNAHNEFVAPALSPIILNVSMIVGTIVGALVCDPPIMGIVYGVVVGGALQVLAQLPALKRHGLLVGPRFDFARDRATQAVMRGFVPGLFGLAVYQINIVVLRQLASHMSACSVSYYYTSDRLMELVNGVFAIAIAQGAFTAMNEAGARGDLDSLKRIWRTSFDLTNLIAIPAALGLAVLAKPIVSVLFLHGAFRWDDVEQTALNVTTASFGLVFAASVRGTAQVFFALKDRSTQVKVGIVVVIVNAALGSAIVAAGIGVHGLSFTLSISNAVQAILLMLLIRRKTVIVVDEYGERAVVFGALGIGSVLRSGAAKLGLAIVAVGAAWGVSLLGDWPRGFSVINVVVLGASIGVAVAIYGTAALVLRLRGADDIGDKIRRKLNRR